MGVEPREGMTDQLSLFGERAVVRLLGGGEAGSGSEPTGERQAPSASDRGQRFGGERWRLTPPPLPRPLTREAPEDAPDAFGGGRVRLPRLDGRFAGFAGGRDVGLR